ncbi:hypothetical protein Tco_1369757 [Tanacetum coccineum]
MNFGALHEGIALQNLNQFCHVSYSEEDRSFTSQAWNRFFRIHEQVVREYVMEFLSSFTFRDHIVDLDNANTMVFLVRRGRHSGKEKVTMDDLFLLHNMDGGARVDVPWHVAKFFTDKGKGYKKKSLIMGAHLIRRIARSYGLITQGSLRSVTLRPETSLLNMAKLVDLGICRYNGLGYGELVDDIPDNGEDEDVVDASNDDEGGMKMEQERFQTWNADHLSHLLSYHHINNTRYDGTHYSYVPNIPDLRVQQGVNFMSSTPVYSTAPSQSPSPNPFELFGDADA